MKCFFHKNNIEESIATCFTVAPMTYKFRNDYYLLDRLVWGEHNFHFKDSRLTSIIESHYIYSEKKEDIRELPNKGYY